MSFKLDFIEAYFFISLLIILIILITQSFGSNPTIPIDMLSYTMVFYTFILQIALCLFDKYSF